MLKALSAGVGLALMLIVVLIVLAVSGVVPGVFAPRTVDRIIVIATAPDADGTEVAAFAYLLERGATTARPIDTTREVAVAGTSARSPRDAFPYVGAEGVAALLQKQVADGPVGWIALSMTEWTALIDSMGGVQIDVPEDVSVYLDGHLVVLESGTQRLLGQEAGALAAAAEYGEADDSSRMRQQLSMAISSAVVSKVGLLPPLVREGRVKSSMTPELVQEFFTPR